MRVTDIDVSESARGARLSAAVVARSPRLPATTLEFVFWGVPATAIDTPGDALAAVCFPAAVLVGEDLHVDAPVSATLVHNTQRLLRIWRTWYPRWHRVAIEASSFERPEVRPTRVSAAFSGGVDSFYTALKPRDEPIDTLITVLGILGGGLPSLETLVPDLTRAADEMGKDHVVVDTNAFVYGRLAVPDSFHIGAVLAAPALAMGGRVRRHYIASGPPLWRLHQAGSHPATDPLWSTETLEVVHDGIDVNKTTKIFAIAHNDIALRHLNVCQSPRPSAANCGRCTKCQLTALVLRLSGTLDRCPTLGPVDARTLRRTPLGIYLENFHELRDEVPDEAMRRAIDQAVRRARYRRRLRPLGRALRGAARARERARLRR